MSKPKAPSGCYWRGPTIWSRLKVKGREYRWSLRTNDPKVARVRRRADRERYIAEVHYGDSRRSFEDVAEKWIEQIVRQISKKTVIRYACSLSQLAPFLDGKMLDQIDGALVGEIIARRGAEQVSNATIRRDLVALSSVMNFAVVNGWCDVNPVLARMRLVKERRDPITLPEPAAIERMIAVAPGMLAGLIRAAWLTGCRQDELVSVRRDKLDHPRRQLTVRGKGNKIRVIDLEPFGGYDVLRDLPVMIGRPWLFWTEGGVPFRNVSSKFQAITRRLRRSDPEFVPFRFHDLRHRHAVDWLKSGRSIYDLQQRLGHASIKTTEIYLAYLTPEERRTAMLTGSKRQG